MSSSVFLKLVVKFCAVDLLPLPAKEMSCDFKRTYILPFYGGEMSFCCASLSAGINQCSPSDVPQKKRCGIFCFCSAFHSFLAIISYLKRHYYVSSIRAHFSPVATVQTFHCGRSNHEKYFENRIQLL